MKRHRNVYVGDEKRGEHVHDDGKRPRSVLTPTGWLLFGVVLLCLFGLYVAAGEKFNTKAEATEHVLELAHIANLVRQAYSSSLDYEGLDTGLLEQFERTHNRWGEAIRLEATEDAQAFRVISVVPEDICRAFITEERFSEFPHRPTMNDGSGRCSSAGNELVLHSRAEAK